MTDRDDAVLVAGAGAAGLAAALAAAERGCSVVLAEAREHFRTDCNTALSTSMVPAGGSRWQRELGIDDSPERFYDDVMRKTHGEADPTVARALTQVAPVLVEWLAERCAVPLSLATDFSYPGHSRQRCHAVPDRAGATLHRHLLDAVLARPEVTFACPMALRAVRLDASGAVAYAVVAPPGGAEEELPVRAVVLASGGFGGDRGLVRTLIGEIADGLYFGSSGCDGRALSIGRALGADEGYLDSYQGHGSVATPANVMVTWANVMHGAILVNATGKRVADETRGYSEFARTTLTQPGGVMWVILDRRIDDACASFADHRALRASGAIRWSDDARALAASVGCDAATLAETLAAARLSASEKIADAFGRTHWEAPLAPPYGAVKVTGALFHTQGGLLVDGDARVLRKGAPISGLFAAGGAAAGISGHGAAGYLAGNGLLAALGLGYLAGRAISLMADAAPR